MSNIIYLFLLTTIGSLLGLTGGVLLLFNKKLSKVLEKNSVPFAAGVLITVSLLGLLPEAMEMYGEGVLLIILISFFVAYLFEHLFFKIHHHDHDQNYKSSIPLVIVGDTIHNLIDGVAIGASFMISPGLGLVTAFSTFLHEVPHEIGDFGILLKAGWKKRNIIKVNLISASVTFLGAFGAVLLLESEKLLGLLLGISAGVFLYLGTVDFLPHAAEKFSDKTKSLLPLGLGIIAMLGVLMLVPHTH